jgi:hypothetical protein
MQETNGEGRWTIRLVSVLAFFNPEDRSDMFLSNVGGLSTNYKVLWTRR